MTAPATNEGVDTPRGPADGLGVAEVLGLQVRHFSAMGWPTTLVCRRYDNGGRFAITTSASDYKAAVAAGMPVFHARELSAVLRAAENDRAWPADLSAWCARKSRQRGWELKLAQALGGHVGMGPMEAPKGWTFEQLLERIGAELRRVRCHDGA